MCWHSLTPSNCSCHYLSQRPDMRVSYQIISLSLPEWLPVCSDSPVPPSRFECWKYFNINIILLSYNHVNHHTLFLNKNISKISLLLFKLMYVHRHDAGSVILLLESRYNPPLVYIHSTLSNITMWANKSFAHKITL